MEKNLEGDDIQIIRCSDETSERGGNFRAVYGRFACLNGRVPTVDEQFEADNREDRYAHAGTVLGHLPRQISRVSFMLLVHDDTITGRETGNSS